jgi:hypothetical protein
MAKTERIRALDFIRGLCLVIMTVDHSRWPFKNITYHAFGFMTAAEGFVFLSGLVAGFVYARYAVGEHGQLTRRALKRAWVIYAHHVAALVICILIENRSPTDHFPGIFLLLYQPGLLDILPMYVIFVLCVPFILRGYQNNKGTLILIASFIIWVFAQFGIRDSFRNLISQYTEAHLGYFDAFAWQFLFVAGTWVGYKGFHEKSVQIPRNTLLTIIAVAATLVMLTIRHGFIRPQQFQLPSVQRALGITHLGWLRLLNVSAIIYTVALLIRSRPELFRCRWLEFIGRHSLQVYTYHVLIIYFLYHSTAPVEPQGKAAETIIALLLVLSLTLPALLHKQYAEYRKPHQETASKS